MRRVLFFIVLVTCVNLGYSLWCYSCASRLGSKSACETRVTNSTVQQISCSPGYTTCMTLVANGTINRACAQPNVCTLLHYNYTSCSTCTYNLCNRGSNGAVTPSYSLSILMSIVFFSAFKLFV